MRLATYTGWRSDILLKGEVVEIHMKGELAGNIKYLAKKHFLLNDYPFASMQSLTIHTIYTKEKLNFYVRNRDFIWVNEEDIDFIVSNSSVKHVLQRIED